MTKLKKKVEKIIQRKLLLQSKLARVKIARDIILSGFFNPAEIAVICDWLSFSDTAFRDKSPQEKLNDYLLDEEYWKKHLKEK